MRRSVIGGGILASLEARNPQTPGMRNLRTGLSYMYFSGLCAKSCKGYTCLICYWGPIEGTQVVKPKIARRAGWT